MSKSTHTFLVRLLTGLLATAGASAFGQVTTSTLKVNAPSTDDLARTRTVNGQTRLRKTQNENTQEQADVKLFPGTQNGVYIEMRTSDLNGALPPNRVQVACSPFQLTQNADGSVGAVKTAGEKFITNNDGEDYRNGNQPYLVPLTANTMLVTYNYRPRGDRTNRYAMIIDKSCNAVPLVNASGQPIAINADRNSRGNTPTQQLIMRKNNDDCSMQESGGGADTRILPSGATRMVAWMGCNGNGEDKGWLATYDVSCNTDATGATTSCSIAKQFDVALAQREERSRGRCSMSSADPDTAICSWTEGNNQPQRDGVWAAAVNVGVAGTQGPSAQDRILWKQMVDGRQLVPNQGGSPKNNGLARAYSVRAQSGRILALDASGKVVKTDTLFFNYGYLIGNNTNNKKGGRYVDHRLGVMQANAQGLKWIVPVTSIRQMMAGFDATHIVMTSSLAQNGSSVVPVVTFTQGSAFGGGFTPPDIKALTYDAANARFVDMGTYQLTGSSFDRGWYSNLLGQNPGVQGRNFAGHDFALNPFYGMNGNTSKFLVFHALTGKDPADAANAALKTSSYVTVSQLNVQQATTTLAGLNGTGGMGGGQMGTAFVPEVAPGSLSNTPTQPKGEAVTGCSVAPGASSEGGLWVLVAGLALLGVGRRASRRNADEN